MLVPTTFMFWVLCPPDRLLLFSCRTPQAKQGSPEGARDPEDSTDMLLILQGLDGVKKAEKIRIFINIMFLTRF